MTAGDAILTRPIIGESDSRFDRIVAGHRPRVLRVAYRLLGRWEDAQDAAQEVFLRLLQHLDRIDGDPTGWLYRVTVNVCHDQHRHQRPAVELAERADPSPGPEAALEQEERKRLLMLGLQSLTPRERAAVVLRDIEGLDTKTVADLLGVEEGTIRSQISMARVKLAKFVRRKPR